MNKMRASLQAEFLRVCETGDLERVKQLLGEGVDINTQNNVCVSDEFVLNQLSSVWKDSPPSCLLWRSCGGRDCVVESWSSNRCSRLGLDS
jgi:hypothetical protein